MAKSLFDNTMGFRPSGTTLKFWVLLPQISNSIDGKSIPSIYGNLKSLALPSIMVVLLIILEGILIFQLNDEGVGFMAIIALSAFDFVIAVLPVAVFLLFNLYPARVNADAFILKTKIDILDKIPKNRANRSTYENEIRSKQKSVAFKKTIIFLIEFIFAIAIICLGYWKFITYFAVFKEDIYVEAIGRLILAVILLSIITHIFFTKTFFTYQLFDYSLKKQLREFENQQHKISLDETNKQVPLVFDVNYSPERADNQIVAQKYRNYTPKKIEDEQGSYIDIIHNGVTDKFRIDEFDGNDNIFLIYTGLLTDEEINKLYATQIDTETKRAIIAQAKEIQINQFA